MVGISWLKMPIHNASGTGNGTPRMSSTMYMQMAETTPMMRRE